MFLYNSQENERKKTGENTNSAADSETLRKQVHTYTHTHTHTPLPFSFTFPFTHSSLSNSVRGSVTLMKRQRLESISFLLQIIITYMMYITIYTSIQNNDDLSFIHEAPVRFVLLALEVLSDFLFLVRVVMAVDSCDLAFLLPEKSERC